MYITKHRNINAAIPDNNKSGLADTIKIAQAGSIESLSVRVNIKHPYTNDIKVVVTAPNGNTFTLVKKGERTSRNIINTFDGKIFNKLAGKSAKGDWKIKVVDAGIKDQGVLVNWGLNLKLTAKNSNQINTPINTKTKLVSKHYCHETGKIASVKAFVDIAHKYTSDLGVDLTSPSGKTVNLFKGNKSDKKNLKKTVKADLLKKFIGEKANGYWSLAVKDSKARDLGKLKKWSLDITTK